MQPSLLLFILATVVIAIVAVSYHCHCCFQPFLSLSLLTIMLPLFFAIITILAIVPLPLLLASMHHSYSCCLLTIVSIVAVGHCIHCCCQLSCHCCCQPLCLCHSYSCFCYHHCYCFFLEIAKRCNH